MGSTIDVPDGAERRLSNQPAVPAFLPRFRMETLSKSLACSRREIAVFLKDNGITDSIIPIIPYFYTKTISEKTDP
jgi:hypothetical protein